MPRRQAAAWRAIAIVPGLCLAACSAMPPPAPHPEIVRGELAGIIATKGSPCGRVLDYSLDERLNYRVRCESGHAYRIRVTAEGHVEAAHQAASIAPGP